MIDPRPWALVRDHSSRDTQWRLKDRPPRCSSTRSAPISVRRRSGRPSSWTCSRSWRRTVTEMAEECRAAPRGVRILADYLTILGFLHKHGDRYELTDDARVFLDRASPAYVGGAARFMLAPELKEGFHQLTAAVRRGGTAVSDEGT